MKRLAVFPGQGAQKIGMGRDLAETYTAAQDVFSEVDDALGYKLSNTMWNGTESDLMLTEHAQPALMAVSIAALRACASEHGDIAMRFDYYAGHSLGEYTALCAAGALSLWDTARLLQQRGQAMQKAVPVGQGAMAALLGVGVDQAITLAAKAAQATGKVCSVANDNDPNQVVISGHKAAIGYAVDIAKQHAVKRAVVLPVSAPFHCPLMQPAAEAMRTALAKVKIDPPIRPVLSNVLRFGAIAEDIRTALIDQITERVRWRESIVRLSEQGVTHSVEIGVGRALSGMIKRTVPAMHTTTIGNRNDIETYTPV